MSKIRVLLLVMLSLALVLTMTGCGDPDGEGAKVVEEGKATPASSEKKEEAPKVGTRENPLKLGTTAAVGDWEVTVKSVNPDAWAAVKKANEFNEAPAKGSKYVLVDVDAKYTGEESGTFWADMSYKFLGSGGNTFDTAMVATDNQISEAGETFPGANVSGTMVFQVPADQIDGGAIILEESFTEGSRTFWSATK